MQRIAIIGCGGSGKSTLARKLGKILDLPVIHLDRIYWQPNWTPLDNATFDAKQREDVAHDRWIIDGNYSRTWPIRFARADTIIYLDLPTHVCLWRVVKRWFIGQFKKREDMASGCVETLDLEFLDWVANFRTEKKPGMLRRLKGYEDTKRVIVIENDAAIHEFVSDATTSSETALSSVPRRARYRPSQMR